MRSTFAGQLHSNRGIRLRHIACRIWVRLRLKIVRVANLGRNSSVIRGVFGIVTRIMGLLAHLLLRIGGALGVLSGWIYKHAVRLRVPAARVLRKAGALLRFGMDEVRQALWFVERRPRTRTAPMLLLASVTIMIISLMHFGIGLEVMLNGTSIGFVESREQVEEILQEVEEQTSAYLGAPYHLDLDVTYSLRYLERENMLDPQVAKNLFLESINQVSNLYVVTVNDEAIAANSSKSALEMMLNRIKESNSFMEMDVKTEFVQDVQIVERTASDVPVLSIPEIEAILTSDSQETVIYTVKSGDTISRIASRYDLAVREIEELNPDLNVDRINIGDEITVSAAVPYLSLKQICKEEYEEDIGFDTIIEYDDNMYVNQSKVKVAGVPGRAFIIADVVYVNGVEDQRNVLEYQVLSEPQNQVTIVGTKKLPPTAPKGYFIKPSNGIYSSGYGYRKNLGDFHTGTDFRGSVGTSIWAADGGTVSFSGWKGNYGYCVIINHGNGYETYYAHCSSLLVKKGQKVAQGEKIAKVGSTGRSTGPHVHFEIRYNGKTVNPLNYISK